MEIKSGLFFGKHIDFKKLMSIMDEFHTEDHASYEIIIDCKEFDPEIDVDFDCVSAHVKKEDLDHLYADIGRLKGHFVWCTNKHWHPTVIVNDVRYEAYAKQSLNGNEIFILTEEDGLEKAIESKDSLLLKLCNLPECMQWLTIKQKDSTFIDNMVELEKWIVELLEY
jgi:hypothetical protein